VAADRLPAAPKEKGAPLCCTVSCSDGALRIAVADEGPGLPKDMAALLNRAASEPAPSPGSKALGLWMIGHLIRRLGYRAEVEHPGVGTQVVVALAVVSKEALDVAA
jgi:sensor histidine kinase regulating citrate/malate metabolism